MSTCWRSYPLRRFYYGTVGDVTIPGHFLTAIWSIGMYDKDKWKQELRKRLEEIAKRKEREKKKDVVKIG